jgi:hypothetical protein
MARWKKHGIGLVLAGSVLAAAAWAGKKEAAPPRWQFAGENQGVRFYFKIANECRDTGAKLELRLENTLDHAVTVSFRLVDPDWKQNFERDLEPNGKDAAIPYTPDEGTACHPYVDEVYVEPRATQVSHSGATEQE